MGVPTRGGSVTSTVLPTPLPVAPTVPPWVRWTAHTVPLLTLPSGLWRIAFGLGLPVGVTGEVADDVPGWTTLYAIALSLFAEGLALLTLGLVQRWGEVVPRWVPRLGGRRIPVLVAAVPAALGAAALTWISVGSALGWNDPASAVEGFPEGGWAILMTACYAPLLLWGPLLAVVTAAYVVRRVKARPPAQRLARTSPVS
jgi:hypothetical protein